MKQQSTKKGKIYKYVNKKKRIYFKDKAHHIKGITGWVANF